MNKANHITAVIAGLAIVAATSGLAAGQSVEDWNKVIAAAKKERKVVIYGTTTVRDFSMKIAQKFKQRYGITVEYLSGRSREVRERVKTEVRTGRQTADIAQAGATTLPAIIQDGNIEHWLPPSIKFVRPDILKAMNIPALPIVPVTVNLRGIIVNTRLVPSGEEPRSFRDLADPKWRGKILLDDPRSAGAGNSLFVSILVHPDLGEEFHRKLAQNKPVFLGSGGHRQIVKRVAQGEYPLGLPADVRIVVKLKKSPVRWIAAKEGVAYSIPGAALVKNAPRPNAAKLFLDYMLSETFQVMVSQDGTPIRVGIKPANSVFDLDRASLLPRPLAINRKQREAYYRLAESIYGIR